MEGEEKYLDAFRRTLPVLIDKEMNKVRKQQRGLMGLVCVLLGMNLLLLGGGLWMLLSPGKALPGEAGVPAAPAAPIVPAAPAGGGEAEEPRKREHAESDDPLAAAAARWAELAAARADEEYRVRQADAVAARQKQNDSRIPDHILTEQGMSLRSLAQRYYGHEVFWVCIYDCNMDVLSSADALPPGIRLKLPRPEDYGIDAGNPSSLQRARKLGRSLPAQ